MKSTYKNHDRSTRGLEIVLEAERRLEKAGERQKRLREFSCGHKTASRGHGRGVTVCVLGLAISDKKIIQRKTE
jgi:hypothetical protein